jgi:hypothetical protein
MTRIILLLGTCMVAACTPRLSYPYIDLVDQRTFWPAVEKPDAAQVKALPPLPLAIIRFGAGAPDFTPALSEAVEAALIRKPEVEFNVVTPIAPGAEPSQASARDATDVAHAIAEQSVPTERIHVGTVEDAGASSREVRVYVR